MLKPNRRVRVAAPDGAVTPRVAIVASEYNRRHVDGLLEGVRGVMREAGVDMDVIRVPGAFEIPLVADCMASGAQGRYSVVICLGVVIRGETAHADLIGEAVTQALMDISLRHRVPLVHEVLLVADRAQADARCLDPRFNRGVEAARTGLAMARLMLRFVRPPGGRNAEGAGGRRRVGQGPRGGAGRGAGRPDSGARV